MVAISEQNTKNRFRWVREFITDNFRKPVHNHDPKGKPRIEFVDLAKGVCILLVVAMHFGYSAETPALKAMRVPLYIILSGLFDKDYGGIKQFFGKKINRILIPFCFFVLFALIIKIISYHSFNQIPNILIEELPKPFQQPNVINSAVWFLICLFEVNVIYYIIGSLVKPIWLKGVLVFFIGVVGLILDIYHLYLPSFMSSACSATPFFMAGAMMRKLPILYSTDKDRMFMVISIVLMACSIGYYCFFGTPHIEFRQNIYRGNIIAIYIVSITLVVGLMMLCKAVGWLPVISYLGIVLGLRVVFRSAILQATQTLNLPLERFQMLVIVLFLCWISIPLCRRFIPFFTAQADLIKSGK